MTEAEQMDYDMYSDLYKEVYGFRPRNGCIPTKEDFEFLNRELERVQKEQSEKEDKSIKAFESDIKSTMANIGCDRETAIYKIIESIDYNDDLDYCCYVLGLPYGYLG